MIIGRPRLIGDVLLLRVSGMEDVPSGLGEELHRRYPRARSILAYGGIAGPLRIPETRLIWGEEPGAVTHREHGVTYELEPQHLMFCLGNSRERLRVALAARSWEVVVDMFAGVGQFSLPIALYAAPRAVYAIEINERAYRYLCRNIEANGVGGVVRPIHGDCREAVGGLRGVADRVVMGYIGGTSSFIPAALEALSPAGGVVHLHEAVRRGALDEYESGVIGEIGRLGYRAAVVHRRVVKSYSPSRQHVVLDLLIAPPSHGR